MAPTMRSCSVSTSDGSTTFRSIDSDHFTAALHGDLHQTAAGLAVHLGVGQRFLRPSTAVEPAAPVRGVPTCPGVLQVA
jgi:hypothetical protein